MKRMGNYQWPFTLDASLDGGRTSEKWPRFLCMGSVQRAKFKGIITITGVVGLLLRVKRCRCL